MSIPARSDLARCRRWRYLLATLLLVSAGSRAQYDDDAHPAITSFSGLQIRLVDPGAAAIWSGGRGAVILEEGGREVWRSGGAAFAGRNRIGVHGLADIDADGVPELHLVAWDGGGNCCLTHHFLQRDERGGVHVKASVEQHNGDQSPLLVVEGRKRPFMLVPDGVFDAAFGACRGCSPTPFVPVSYDGNRFSLAIDVMKQPELLDCLMSLPYLDAPDLTLLATRWRAACRDVARQADSDVDVTARLHALATSHSAKLEPDSCDPCIIAAKVMNPLVYAGEFVQAEAALKRVWPTGMPGRQNVSALYWSQVQKSIYWRDIQAAHFETLRKATVTRVPIDGASQGASIKPARKPAR